MPTAAELSPTQRRWVVQQSGFDPSTHELDDNGFIKPIRASVAPSVSDNDFPHPKVEPTAPETPGFAATAIHSAINAAPAAAIGSSAAALVAPWSSAVAQIPHPLAKLAYLIPPAVGAIAGGLEHYGQTKAQEALVPDELAKLQAMQQANPWGARVGGGAAMMVGGFNPNPLNVARAAGSLGKVISKPLTGINLTAPELQNLANVGIGTGVGTGITAAQNLVTGRPIEEGLGESAITSAIFNSPNAIGRRMGFENPVDVNIHPTRDDLVNGTPIVAPSQDVAPTTPLDINAYLAAGNEIHPSAPSITPESVMANLFPGQTIASRAVKQTTPRSPIFTADPELQLLNAQGQIPEPSTVKPITRYKTVQPPAKNAEASWRDIEMLTRENAPVEQRLRLTDYVRAMREKQAQDNAELLQAASTQQQQLTAQKLQVGAELLNQQKAQHEAELAELQAAMRGNQLGGVEVAPKPLVETPLGKDIYPDYTGVKEAGNAEVANPPPIDIEAEAAQERLSKYSEGGALRPQTEAEKQANERLNAAGIQLTPTQEWNAKMQNVATYRGQKLTTDKPVRNAQGQEMAGMATGREAFVSPTKGQIVTAPHEMQGHNFVNDLRNSKSAADRKLASDYDAFTASNPEFQAINAERAKQGLEPWTPEEFNANNAGAEYVMDRLGLRNESEFKTWWNDIASHYKTKQGGANAADFQRVLNYKFVNDAPFNPANYTGVGAAKEQFSEGQPKSADRIRYEEIQKSIMDHVMRDDTDSPEFAKLWQESEDIKNRNGGNPPKYSEGGALRAAAPDFKLTTQKELEKDKPFGLQVSRNGTVESKQLRAKLNSLPASEQEMLRMSGVDELMKLPAVSVNELREHLDANAPKVEVHSYGMEGKVSEVKKEYDRMTHEWYENLSDGAKRLVNWSRYEEMTEGNREKALKYLGLQDKVNSEPADTSPRATQYYSTVSALPTDQPMPEWTASKSGKNVQRVDVVIPVKREPYVTPSGEVRGTIPSKATPELWQPDNLHENLPNTLGWAMLQYKTGPKGEKIAVIAEAQSRWGQQVRKYKDTLAKNPAGDWDAERGLKNTDHPLLRDYNRLILKAAIDQARKEGATHIVVSDAETAMMTEGHDTIRSYTPAEIAEEKLSTLIPQESGMRLNYDTILPRIAEELTGSKGERVSLGEHKNAYMTPNNVGTDLGSNPRSNLIFRNPDGTPKTDVSGRMYPIEGTSLAARREAGEPFSLTAPKYSEGDALRKQTETPEFKKWFGESKVVDKEGKPLVVYHGTRYPSFNVFSTNPQQVFSKPEGDYSPQMGAHFGTTEQANKHTFAQNSGQSPAVYPVYLTIKNPLRLPDSSRWEAVGYYPGVLDRGVLSTIPDSVLSAKEKQNIENLSSQGRIRELALQRLLEHKGYDGIVYANQVEGPGDSYIAFRPEQIKSAIGNRGTFDANNPDIRFSEGDALRSEAKHPTKQPWITPLIANEIQKIERIGTPRAKAAANAVREFYRINSRNRGQLETSFIRDVITARPWELSAKGLAEWAKMDTPENAKVVDYLNDMSDAGKSEIKLSPVEQKIADAVRANLLKSKAMMESFKTAGDIEGLAHGTSADPNYFPHLMSRKASRIIAETPDSAEAMQMHKDFVEHNMKKGGMTEAEAEDKWALLKGGYAQQKAQLAQQFGPIDKLAGVGLPRSMRETNLFDIMSRFNRRYARRLAYHEAIERNQAASDALFNPKNGLEANKEVKNVLEDIYGVREHNEDIRRAATGIIRAGMIGTLAGVKDFTTNMVLGMQHMDIDQPIPSLVHAFETAKENYRKAQDTGVVRYNFAGVEQGEGGFTDVMHWLDRARDIANTAQGRALLENGARTIAMGQGQFLAREALHALANKKLTAQKRKFLDDFVPNWENYKTTAAPDAVITEAAARFVESVQGTYDYRGLPSIAMKGTLAPYLSLARWNIEKFNNFMQHTIEPARNGNWTPLLMSTVGMLIGGAAVEQIVELAQHKKSKLPELSEIEAAKEEEQWKLAAYKLAGYASMSGYAGVLADVAKIGADTAYKNRVNTYNNPLIEGLTTATADFADLWATANEEGISELMKAERIAQAIGVFLEDFSQTYRIANAQLNPDKQKANERSDKYRDLKLFNMGQGNDLPDSGDTRPNPFLSPETKQFKQTGDVEEAKKLGKELIEKAVKKANGDPEVLMAELSKLKHNSYQTMPSPDTLPAKFIKYYNWLVKTQGQAKADEVKADYIRQNVLNRAKSGMIP